MKPLNHFLVLAKNKYFVVFAFFLIWMAFFDPRDWGLIFTRSQKLRDLQKSETQLIKDIESTKKELSSLQSSSATIEKYAREKYLMKKDNEEIFLVKTP